MIGVIAIWIRSRENVAETGGLYATHDPEGISRQPQRQIHCHLPLARFHGARNCRTRAYSGERAGKNVADESLAKDKEIAFNAGSHRELVRLASEEFEKLVKPKIIKFAAGAVGETAA